MRERMRNLSFAMSLVALGLSQAAAEPSDKKAVTYRWVDEKGVVHYGDRVPPQYTEKESILLNREGVEVGKLEAQKTPEQLAEEARRQQAALRQKQHDSFLLTTYASVADIERLRDERLDTIQGQRQAAEQYVENLRSSLALLKTRAMMFKPYNPRAEARRLPDDLAEDLVRTLNEMRTQQGTLDAKDAEEASLRKQFQGDIERYKELRTARAGR